MVMVERKGAVTNVTVVLQAVEERCFGCYCTWREHSACCKSAVYCYQQRQGGKKDCQVAFTPNKGNKKKPA